MEISLTFGSIASLFATMLTLALVPSLSVMTVTARAVSLGLRHGAAAALGIVAGDMLFILVAVLGLAALASSTDGAMTALKYGGGVYLIWLGVRFWRAGPAQTIPGATSSRLSSSFLAGLLLTLGDHKAILFYFVFFPAFVDLSAVTTLDIMAILVIAAISVGMAKIAYAYTAVRAIHSMGGLMTPLVGRYLNLLAAAVLVLVGVFLILKP